MKYFINGLRVKTKKVRRFTHSGEKIQYLKRLVHLSENSVIETPIICFCHYQNGENIITTVSVVLTFSTSSGSMQMSCNERFKGIALMFKGEVEPMGITRTSISYFFLCSSHDVSRVISRKQSKLSFPQLNTFGLNNLVKAGLRFPISALYILCF